MRKSISLFLIISLIAVACDLKEKLNELVTFNINQSVQFEIPSSSVVDLPIDVATPDVESSSTQTFENNNTRADLVDRITLSALDLTILSPDTRDFGFLKSVKIYISNDNLGETLIAEKTDIPQNIGQELSLDSSGENVKPYVVEDTYDIITEVVTRETVNSKTEINADLTFEVQATTF